MAFQYFKNKGESRPLFISLTNSYHGETMGALAVSDTGLYKDIYLFFPFVGLLFPGLMMFGL